MYNDAGCCGMKCMSIFVMYLFLMHRPLEGAEENVRRLTGKKDLVLPYPHCCPTNRESHTQCPLCGVIFLCYLFL